MDKTANQFADENCPDCMGAGLVEIDNDEKWCHCVIKNKKEHDGDVQFEDNYQDKP